jgi:hypothetical protein
LVAKVGCDLRLYGNGENVRVYEPSISTEGDHERPDFDTE